MKRTWILCAGLIVVGSTIAGAYVSSTNADAPATKARSVSPTIGIDIRVSQVDFNGIDLRVVFTVTVAGGGGRITGLSPVELVEGSGRRVIASEGNGAPDGTGIQSVVFHNVPPSALKGLALQIRAVAIQAPGSAEPVVHSGVWRRDLVVGPSSDVAQSTDLPSAASSSYGPGQLAVRSVVQGAGFTIVRGSLPGISEGQAEVLSGWPSTLTLAGGTTLVSTWYQHTSDGNGVSFEIRFPEAHGRVSLSVPFNIDYSAFKSSRASSAEIAAVIQSAGAHAQLTLNLP